MNSPSKRIARPEVPPKPEGCRRLLFWGDSVGRSGREAMLRATGAWRAGWEIDWVVANGENAAAGFGIQREIYTTMRAGGVDVVTGGNHMWDQREALQLVTETDRLLRPLNFLPGAPGAGSVYLPEPGPGLVVVNLIGRVHMALCDDPFRAGRAAVEAAKAYTPLVFVDFHAEATGEKAALAYHLDGLASAVVGTHTHVQTADERILPAGTGFLTDAGMCGPYDSCIGMDVAVVLRKQLTGLPERFAVAAGDACVNGVIIDLDETSGRTVSLHRINKVLPDTAVLEP